MFCYRFANLGKNDQVQINLVPSTKNCLILIIHRGLIRLMNGAIDCIWICYLGQTIGFAIKALPKKEEIYLLE